MRDTPWAKHPGRLDSIVQGNSFAVLPAGGTSNTKDLRGDTAVYRQPVASVTCLGEKMSPTISAVSEEWIRSRLARREINPNTAYNQKQLLADFAEFVGQDRQLAEIRRSDFEDWLGQPRNDGTPYTAQSINSRSNPVRAFFRWAAETGAVDRNPTAGVPRAKAPKRQKKGLSENDVQRMLWAAGLMDRTMILVGLHLGLRRAEIAQMRLEHWDRRDEVLYVIGKGNRERTLPVAGEVAEAMHLWCDMGLRNVRTGPFWPSNNHHADQISIEHVGRRIKTVANDAGVKATAHSLRHTCASDLVRAGVPLPIVQAWLGHASVSTTGLYVVPGAGELRAYGSRRAYLPAGLSVPATA